MGWVWRDDDDEPSNYSNSFDTADYLNPNSNPSSDSGDRCSTRRIVQSKCNTDEVEPGKFIRKCEKTEQILKDCVGKSVSHSTLIIDCSSFIIVCFGLLNSSHLN